MKPKRKVVYGGESGPCAEKKTLHLGFASSHILKLIKEPEKPSMMFGRAHDSRSPDSTEKGPHPQHPTREKNQRQRADTRRVAPWRWCVCEAFVGGNPLRSSPSSHRCAPWHRTGLRHTGPDRPPGPGGRKKGRGEGGTNVTWAKLIHQARELDQRPGLVDQLTRVGPRTVPRKHHHLPQESMRSG